MAYSVTSRKSIHGRQLAITSSGGLVSDPTGSTTPSTGFSYHAQMWGPGMLTSHTSTAAAISLENSGIQVIASATSTAVVASFRAPPVDGIQCRIVLMCTATAISINTNSTLVVFQSTGASSTNITANSTLGARGQTAVMVGLSTTRWLLGPKTALIG